HQLRGRVGRYKHRAYCYLLLPAHTGLSDVAKRRLKAIEEFSMLGAGFKIAMRDLEIRGAGNLLGPEQSGHIAAVGYDMYCRLLEQSVRELKAEPEPVKANTVSIEIGRGGTIPRPYIPSDARRMEAYRRLATAANAAELESLAEDLRQAYGQPPTAVLRLLELAELRVLANALGVRSVTLKERDIVVRAESPAPVAAALADAKGSVRVLPPASGEKLSEIYFRPPESYLEPDTLIRILRTRFGSVSGRQPEQGA
ncbi:MAG: transcription-repair coupling factor, partial [Phycisphaerales bacterium]